MGIRYRCSACGKVWKEKVWPKQCLVCLRPLCGDCNTNRLCPAHFAQLTPEDKQALYNASRTLKNVEGRQDTSAGLEFLLILSILGFIIIQAFFPTVEIRLRTAVAVISLVGFVAGGILSWVHFRSRASRCKRRIVGILEKNWPFPGGAPVASRESPQMISSPSNLLPEVTLPLGIPREFRDALAAWNAGQYPLPEAQSEVLVISRDSTLFLVFLLFVGAFFICGEEIGRSSIEGIVLYQDPTFIASLIGGIVIILFGIFLWHLLGYKAKALFVSPRGLMSYKWGSPHYIPWDGVTSIRDTTRGIELTLKNEQKMKLFPGLLNMEEVLWSPLFTEGERWEELVRRAGKLVVGRSESYFARIQRRPNMLPGPLAGGLSLWNIFQKFHDGFLARVKDRES